MIETLFHSPFVRRRMAYSHLGIIVHDFACDLNRRGYSLHTVHMYTQAVEHFGYWAKQEGISIKDLRWAHAQSFLRDHLPQCRCMRPRTRSVHGCRAALKQLFSLLKRHGIIVGEKQSADPPVIVQLIEGYDRHMNEVGGLTKATRLYRRRYARDFLLWSLGEKRLGLEELSAPYLMMYVTTRAKSLKPISAGVLAVSLRNFISFCEWNGLCARGLAKAVPAVAVWPHENLPKHLSPDQCQRFLACFDRSTPVGQRDFAMGLCLLDLGLRASEVSAMRIGHIDWRNGIIHLPENKQSRERMIPLPRRVGRALVAYLKNGRPSSQSDHLFLRHRIPYGEPLEVHHVRGAIRQAFQRCGIDATGTHVLRHTFATRLHRKGASLKVVADFLGHRSIDTTSRYARVNLEELRKIVQPWPEQW